jgi:hypothetical protein
MCTKISLPPPFGPTIARTSENHGRRYRGFNAVQHPNKRHQIIFLLPRNLEQPIRFKEHRLTWAPPIKRASKGKPTIN